MYVNSCNSLGPKSLNPYPKLSAGISASSYLINQNILMVYHYFSNKGYQSNRFIRLDLDLNIRLGAYLAGYSARYPVSNSVSGVLIWPDIQPGPSLVIMNTKNIALLRGNKPIRAFSSPPFVMEPVWSESVHKQNRSSSRKSYEIKGHKEFHCKDPLKH